MKENEYNDKNAIFAGETQVFVVVLLEFYVHVDVKMLLKTKIGSNPQTTFFKWFNVNVRTSATINCNNTRDTSFPWGKTRYSYMFSLNFEGCNIFFNIRWKKRFKNVSTYHKKMRGIFKFFGGCSAWSLQQRSAKTTAKTPQRRHKDGRPNRKGPRMLQRWTRPHWRYIVLICTYTSSVDDAIFAAIPWGKTAHFRHLCRSLQRSAKMPQRRHFWVASDWRFLEFYGGRGFCFF